MASEPSSSSTKSIPGLLDEVVTLIWYNFWEEYFCLSDLTSYYLGIIKNRLHRNGSRTIYKCSVGLKQLHLFCFKSTKIFEENNFLQIWIVLVCLSTLFVFGFLDISLYLFPRLKRLL